MKRFVLLIASMVVMSSFSLYVSANDDSKYPIYDFEPTVLYRSEGLLAELKAEKNKPKVARITPKADPKYPVAYFTPYVIYPAPAKK